jgi:hypothetical protein
MSRVHFIDTTIDRPVAVGNRRSAWTQLVNRRRLGTSSQRSFVQRCGRTVVDRSHGNGEAINRTRSAP